MSAPSYSTPLTSELMLWLQIWGENRNVYSYELPTDTIINRIHFISLVMYLAV